MHIFFLMKHAVCFKTAGEENEALKKCVGATYIVEW